MPTKIEARKRGPTRQSKYGAWDEGHTVLEDRLSSTSAAPWKYVNCVRRNPTNLYSKKCSNYFRNKSLVFSP
jgi:hypothetical protein